MINHMCSICVTMKQIWPISLKYDIKHFVRRDGNILFNIIRWREPIARKKRKQNSKEF